MYRTERYYGYVHRSLPLPEDVDQENVEARFDRGVLTVRLPKLARKEESSKSIPIRGNVHGPKECRQTNGGNETGPVAMAAGGCHRDSL